MNNRAISTFPFLLLLILLSACNVIHTLNMNQVLHDVSTPAITPTISLLTSTPIAPTPYTFATMPMLPTATLSVPSDIQKGEFYDPETGVRFSYPSRWVVDDSEQQNSIVTINSPDHSLFLLAREVTEATGDLHSTVEDLLTYETTGMDGLRIQKDESITLDSGRGGWVITMLAMLPVDPAPIQIKIGMVVTQSGGVTAELLIFGIPEKFDTQSKSIESVFKSLKVEKISLNGIDKAEALVLAGGESTNPRNYDPATDESSGDKLVFSGLVMFDNNLNLMPDLAESWDISPDGTIYIFHLRENAYFHNGRPVTAADVVYSWDRAADPRTSSITVLTYLGDIEGIKERHENKAKFISGLQIIDDHTLRVKINSPVTTFLFKLTFPTAFVVDKQNVEASIDWYRRPNGTGPYKLIRWDRFSLKIYEKNDNFYLQAPAIPYIIIKIFADTNLSMYESGDIDITGVSIYDLDRIKDPSESMHEELYSQVSLCTDYFAFDVTQAPFDDLKVRQAFTLAFDRQKLISTVYKGSEIEALGLFPPALPGFNDQLNVLPFNPSEAQKLLDESRYGGVKNLPPIVFTSTGFGSEISTETSALLQIFRDNLGVEIRVENIPPDQYMDEIKKGNHGQIFTSGWCADYPDPENFADVLFRTGSEMNFGNYSNPAVDALLDKGKVEKDVSIRLSLYQEAEQLIVEDSPVIFIGYPLDYVLVKPWIDGFVLSPIDISLERYLSFK